MDRYFRERAYHIRRKQTLKQQKRGNRPTFSVISMNKGFAGNGGMRDFTAIRKIIGVALMVIALLLVLSQCFFNGNTKDKNSSPTSIGKQASVSHASTIDDSLQSGIDYNTALQDFPVNPLLMPKLLKTANRYQQPFSDALAIWCIANAHQVASHQILRAIRNKDTLDSLSTLEEHNALGALYEQFIYDIEKFPLPSKVMYHYEDTWKNNRTYKSDRKHYGSDIMSGESDTAHIPIKSITDGVVENIGWNELGGYRVGIRSNGGAYFYYAHLAQMPTGIEKGDYVTAGEEIGLMGDTGYGPEGTRGKFPVHLHIGIALTNKEQKEYWINPYPILQYLEKVKR